MNKSQKGEFTMIFAAIMFVGSIVYTLASGIDRNAEENAKVQAENIELRQQLEQQGGAK